MSDPQDSESMPVVFELDTPDLSLNRLLNATQLFLGVLREVDREAASGRNVQWIVASVSKASPLRLAVQPFGELPRQLLDEMSQAVVDGIEFVASSGHRPPYFSDRALERLRDLTALSKPGQTMIRVSRGTASAALSAQLLDRIDSLLGGTVSSIGTVEGWLERINVHGPQHYFVVYDALTGQGVRCSFGKRVSVEEVGNAAKRRVAVHGEIRYRENGEIESVNAHSLDVFPREEELPTPDDVLGILEG